MCRGQRRGPQTKGRQHNIPVPDEMHASQFNLPTTAPTGSNGKDVAEWAESFRARTLQTQAFPGSLQAALTTTGLRGYSNSSRQLLRCNCRMLRVPALGSLGRAAGTNRHQHAAPARRYTGQPAAVAFAHSSSIYGITLSC